jgi:peptidoglycan hydrolase-like protein with peptidoglycan-binding domain
MDTLKHGDSGLSVEELQTELNLADLTRLPRLTVDGQFNALTVGRVMEFQSLNGLTVDGVVGPQTNGRLPLAPSENQQTAQFPDRQKHPRRPLRAGSPRL